MSVDQDEFRLALGCFASGVTVITTHHAGNLYGTTVSSFCSLSLHPSLVLVCIVDLLPTSLRAGDSQRHH
ncbi:MAG TPA: flavin reductase [Ktedonobacteraceae bacterium]|nr:flavin reductase [Ktedonobacteraceae bacterium]